MRILLINSEKQSLENIKNEIQEHYIVDVAFNGVEGDYLAQTNDYAAIVIESQLPDINNTELCRKTREYDDKTPILVLLDNLGLDEKIASLDCGADAVLTKPVHPRELMTYLRILIKRANGDAKRGVLKAADLSLQSNSKKVVRAGKEIVLRRKEYEILEYLLLNKGRILSQEQILENVWEWGLDIRSNTLPVHMKTLRDKIDRPFDKPLIKTVYGFGYKLCG